MTRAAAVLGLALLVAGCASAGRSVCAEEDKRRWKPIRPPPSNAVPLIELAEKHPDAGFLLRRGYERWFALPTGEVMFCRFDTIAEHPFPDRICASQWWQFGSGPNPGVTKQGGTLCT